MRVRSGTVYTNVSYKIYMYIEHLHDILYLLTTFRYTYFYFIVTNVNQNLLRPCLRILFIVVLEMYTINILRIILLYMYMYKIY